MRICFDLDGVICYVKRADEKYENCKPNYEMIKLAKQLKEAGHTIIINTARGMLTYKANLGEVNKNLAGITIDWLDKHNVKYDEIYFGKPNAHVTIDDRTIRYDRQPLGVEEVLSWAKER